MDIVIRLHPSLAQDIEKNTADSGRVSRLVEQAVRVVSKFGPDITYARIASKPAKAQNGQAGGPGADHAMSARRVNRNCIVVEIDAADTAVTSRVVVPGEPAVKPVRPGRRERL